MNFARPRIRDVFRTKWNSVLEEAVCDMDGVELDLSRTRFVPQRFRSQRILFMKGLSKLCGCPDS